MRATSSIHWNAYPALLGAGVLGAGIGIARVFDLPAEVWIAVTLAGIFGAVVTSLREGVSQTGVLAVWVAVVMLASGSLRYADSIEPALSDVSFLPANTEIRLSGRPFNVAETQSGVRFFLDVDAAEEGAEESEITGRVQVYLRGVTTGEVSPCRRISVKGRLAPLPRARNPGDFDYAGYLGGHRVFSRMFAEDIDSGWEAGHEARKSLRGPSCLAHQLKTAIERRFMSAIPDDDARAIVLALVIGDRSAIDRETETRFRRTGLLHLLAVSGLHVLIVGMILYQLLRPILLRLGCSWIAAEYARSILTGLVLIMYALITGLPASVVRAVLMALLFMMGTTFQRSSHSLNTLGVAVFVLLVVRPAQLFEPGFQLSVGAVAAIITLQPRFSSMLETRGGDSFLAQSIRSSTSVSLAAAGGTLPVLLFHFGSVSFAGLFLNTIAVPLTSVTLASSVATAAAASISEALGGTLGQAAEFFARSLLFVVERGEPYFRWAYLEARVEDAPVIGALIAAIVMAAQWPRPRLRWRLCTVALGLLALDLIWDASEGEWKATLDAVFLDVGQGDAALITFPNGRTMLVDTGPRTTRSDAGRYTILPYLERRHIKRLDAVVITHPDSDHLGGLPAVLRGISVGRVLHSGLRHDSELYDETLHLLDSLNVPPEPVEVGDTILVDPFVRIHVLHPDQSRFDATPNASSVVLHVRYGRSTLLLLGDAERDQERLIVRRYGELAAADAIKIGHHGSQTSSTALFLSRVIRSNNSIAVVSAGERNRYGHPDSAVVRRLRSYGASIHRTDTQGAVHVISDGRHTRVQDWR